jgi:hypothetical protein
MEALVTKPPSDNKIQSENVPVEEPTDWDNVAIALPHDVKTSIIVAARQERLTVSEWGRKVLMAALTRSGGGVRSEERRKSA